jgi:hypothetical protein
MSIENLSWNENLSNRNNNFLLPRSIRGLIVGKSECGKTNLLLNLLLKDLLDYDNLQVFGKSLFQPEYKIIKTGFENKLPKESLYKLLKNKDYIIGNGLSPQQLLQEAGKKYSSKTPIKCCFYKNGNEIPDPSELKSTDKNLIIFDDILLDKQNKCEDYYVRGRHSNVDSFYLAQNYFRLPRQTIRENSNFLCLFKQDNKNINHIYQDHVSNDMTIKEFKELCFKCWEQPHDFLVIDNSSPIYDGKYRYKLNTFYYPKKLNY